VDGRWEAARDQKMDCALVLRGGAPHCVKQGQVKQGEPVTLRFSERLEAVPNVYASPVGAAGRVYVTGREGTVAVLAAGPKLELDRL